MFHLAVVKPDIVESRTVANILGMANQLMAFVFQSTYTNSCFL